MSAALVQRRPHLLSCAPTAVPVSTQSLAAGFVLCASAAGPLCWDGFFLLWRRGESELCHYSWGAWCYLCSAEFQHPMDWTLPLSLKGKPALGICKHPSIWQNGECGRRELGTTLWLGSDSSDKSPFLKRHLEPVPCHWILYHFVVEISEGWILVILDVEGLPCSVQSLLAVSVWGCSRSKEGADGIRRLTNEVRKKAAGSGDYPHLSFSWLHLGFYSLGITGLSAQLGSMALLLRREI